MRSVLLTKYILTYSKVPLLRPPWDRPKVVLIARPYGMIYSVSDLLMYMMIMVYCVTFLLCGVFVFLLKTVLFLSDRNIKAN